MGIPLCPNKQDVRWCQNATSWEVPKNWTPMYGSDGKVKVKCSLNKKEKDPRGQWISPIEKGDGHTYHCLNRKDEKPFLKKVNTTREENSWLENVNSACPYGEDYRRCLGNRADECICKYNISRKKSALSIKTSAEGK